MLEKIIQIIMFLTIYFFGYFTFDFILMIFNLKKHYKEQHFCNTCQSGFLTNRYELNFEYCPYCGTPLDYHEKDERSRSYKGE